METAVLWRRAMVVALALAAGYAGADARVAPVAQPTSASVPEPILLRRLVDACTVSMANNVCSVAKDASRAGPTTHGQSAVFVVGAGALDRTAYAYLQDGGKAMCARARSACSADWSGAVCTTARSLWSN